MKNKIKDFRNSRDMTQADLASIIGTTQPQVQRLEKSKRRLSDYWIEKLSKVFDCQPGDLFEEKILSKVELVGYVTSDMKIERKLTGETEAIETVDAPYTYANIPRQKIKGVCLKTDVQQPMLVENTILYYYEKNNIEECIGRLCVILDMKDDLHIKQLWQGGVVNTYTLTSLNNASPLMNIEIQAAYKIIGLEPH